MSHRPTNPDTMNDDQFNNVLDAMLRGDRDSKHLRDLDPEMASTLDQLIGWSNLSGFATEPPSQSPTSHTPRGTDEASCRLREMRPDTPPPIHSSSMPRPIRLRRTSRRTILMSTLSGLAAMLLLGLTLYGAIPILSDRSETPTPIMLAGADGTQLADSGGATSPPDIATEVPIGVPGPNADGIDVLTSDECTVAPISRADVIAILRTPPGEYGDVVNTKQMRSGGADISSAIPVDDLNAVFREWQACVRFGSTWQYMALQTDYMTRADIYGPQLLSRPALVNGYSDQTLNELLDGRVQTDAQQRQAWQRVVANGGELPPMVLVIDTTVTDGNIGISEDGTYISYVPIAKLNQVTGENYAPHGYVDFELVNGQWRIAAMHNLDF